MADTTKDLASQGVVEKPYSKVLEDAKREQLDNLKQMLAGMKPEEQAERPAVVNFAKERIAKLEVELNKVPQGAVKAADTSTASEGLARRSGFSREPVSVNPSVQVTDPKSESPSPSTPRYDINSQSVVREAKGVTSEEPVGSGRRASNVVRGIYEKWPAPQQSKVSRIFNRFRGQIFGEDAQKTGELAEQSADRLSETRSQSGNTIATEASVSPESIAINQPSAETPLTPAVSSAETKLIETSNNLLSFGQIVWKEYAKKVLSLAADIYSRLLIKLSGISTSVATGAMGGGVLGSVLGAVIGGGQMPVVGSILGAGGGFVAGNMVGGVAGYAYDTTNKANRIISLAKTIRFLGALMGETSAVFVGGGIASFAPVAVIIIVIFFIVFGMPGTTNIAFSAAVFGDHDEMGKPPTFSVQKTDDLGGKSLSNNETKTITYTISILPTSGLQIDPNSIEITDDAVAYGNFSPKTLSTSKFPGKITRVSDYVFSNTLTVNTATVPDSHLINTVTVKATSIGDASETQLQTAQDIIVIGNPIEGGPYGFPVGGAITSLDDEPFKNKKGVHCALMYIPADTCTPGGIDIAAGSGDVVSTSDGYVFTAGFNCTVGGYVYVQSGAYRVAYIHLKEPIVSKDQKIVRGQVLGKVYDAQDYALACSENGVKKRSSGLDSSTGPHVHYQVARVNENLFFGASRQQNAGQNNVGPCLVDDNGNATRTQFIEKSGLTKPDKVGVQDCTTSP